MRIAPGDLQLAPCLVVVPADEVEGILHVRPAPQQAPPLRLVLAPDGVLRLRVSLGGRGATQGDEAQEPLDRRFGVAPIARFMAHEGHEDVDRRAPLLLGGARMVVPVGVLLEDFADVALTLWRRGGAAGRKSDEDGGEDGSDTAGGEDSAAWRGLAPCCLRPVVPGRFPAGSSGFVGDVRGFHGVSSTRVPVPWRTRCAIGRGPSPGSGVLPSGAKTPLNHRPHPRRDRPCATGVQRCSARRHDAPARGRFMAKRTPRRPGRPPSVRRGLRRRRG